MDLFDGPGFWVPLGQIIMINIVLSGDNAVVIAMASRALPPKQQKQAILFGSFGAIALRIILTFFAVLLLGLPFLKIIGSALLGWIGVKMLVPEDESVELDGHAHLWAAIKTIIIADFIMSLDNVLGVAAAAKGSVMLLVIGLAISIPLIIYGSTLVLKLMNRYPIIITLGGAVLGWVAGEMLITDPAINPWVENNAHWLHTISPGLAALGVVATGKWLAFSKQQSAGNNGDADKKKVAPDGEEAPPGYHWVTRAWRQLPDGTRDYAAYYGKTAFRYLAPVSSRLRSPRR